MGFLDKETKETIAEELATESRLRSDAARMALEAFRSEENLELLVAHTGDLVRAAYKSGKSPIPSVRIDMSLAHKTYGYTEAVAADELCKSALLSALREFEPKTVAVNLVYLYRQTDYHDGVTDRWIDVRFEPPLE